MSSKRRRSTIRIEVRGWYLRKGFNFGPLRLNLSKSGLGYSFGVRGARIGVGPRGNYVRLCHGGVYYQKYFSNAVPRPADVSHLVVPIEVPVSSTRVASVDAAELHDATSEGLLNEIQEKQRKTRLAPIGAIFGSLLVLVMLSAKLAFVVDDCCCYLAGVCARLHLAYRLRIEARCAQL